MSSIQIDILTKTLLSLPLGREIVSFLNYLTIEAGLSPNTIMGYGRDLKTFAQYCDEISIITTGQLKPEIIYNFIRKLSEQDKAETSINRNIVAIKMFFRFAHSRSLMAEDFTAILEGPKQWQRLPMVCNKEKVFELLKAPTPEDTYYLRDLTILELLYATGMRASELAILKTKDINFTIGYLRCFGKGNKERIIPLGRTALSVTQQYIDQLRPTLAKDFSPDNLLLTRTARPMTRIDIWRIVKKYALRINLPPKMTAHTLRHCFATHLLSGGADLRSVQEMLGHVDIATTQIYTHVDQDRLRSIHKQFHPRN